MKLLISLLCLFFFVKLNQKCVDIFQIFKRISAIFVHIFKFPQEIKNNKIVSKGNIVSKYNVSIMLYNTQTVTITTLQKK